MEHLSPETLARLVDEAASPAEEGHLAKCRRCREEVGALKDQTKALSHLPDRRPPEDQWEALEGRLLAEGLLRRETRSAGGGGSRSFVPLQAAAAVLLLVGGAGLGLGASSLLDRSSPVPGAGVDSASVEGSAILAALDPSRTVSDLPLDEAAELVRLTEGWYQTALTLYRERSLGPDTAPGYEDPLLRYAALEALMAAGQVAVREMPTDPFMNGLLVNMRAEREATLRGLQASTAQNIWY
jgi:hypothetical protein